MVSKTKFLNSPSKKRERRKKKKIQGVVRQKRKIQKKIAREKVLSQPSISRKDFETFQFGVERLKELKKELDSLDTRGFAREDKSIRSKLKNVSEIPNIERELKILRLKIKKKYRPKRRVKSRGKLIQEDIQDIKGEIKKLGQKVETKKKGILDSGVEILVDTNFNNFLREIKTTLSERINRKEEEIDSILEADLQKRESDFKEKHLNLIRGFNERKRKLELEFERKYAMKVKSSLHKEISEKFNYELQKGLDAEKIKLSKRFITELREHAKEKLEKQKQGLGERAKEELVKKIRALENQFESEKRKIELEEKKEMERTELERQKIEELKEKEMKKIDSERQQELDNLKTKKIRYGEQIQKQKEKLKGDEEQLLEKERQILLKTEKDKKAIQKAKQDFVLKKEEERKKMGESLVEEAHKKIEDELSKKEKILRVKLANEFELKLKKQIQEHEQEMKKKKLNLELEMQKKMKEVLK
ncbi:MAG: hypothetical protein KKF67_02280 [Nanoarchaeota archaeon]|nr:hypothetical protein [Nanoarchaeota archaeon]